MLVRPGVLTDAEAIADIHVRSWQAAYRGIVDDEVLDSLDPTSRVAGLRTWLQAPGWHVLDDDGAVVGFANASASRDDDAPPNSAEVTTIYLDPAVWRRGWGKLLLESLLAQLAQDGYAVATLWVLEENDLGRRFYEALRWTPDGGRKPVTLGAHSLQEIRYRRILDRYG